MTNELTREQLLQLKYPVGTRGKLIPIDVQTLTHLISKGWEPSFEATVESAYIAGTDNIDFLVVRWGQGQSDWSGVMAEGFQAISIVSDLGGIEKWFDEGYEAALQGKDKSQCPYDDDSHTFYEHLWWNRGYNFSDLSARLLVAEQLIKELKGDRS